MDEPDEVVVEVVSVALATVVEVPTLAESVYVETEGPQGRSGKDGRDGTDGGVPIDLPDLALLFENGII